MLELQMGLYQIIMDADPTYKRGAADNLRIYQHEYDYAGEYRPSSRIGLRVGEQDTEIASCIILAAEGGTGASENSALIHQSSCVAGVGACLYSLSLPALTLNWRTRVDWATCFGVYHSDKHRCYITHGELEVARVSYAGEIVWQSGGADIFTNGFALYDDYVEVIDWNNTVYRWDMASGESVSCSV